MRTKLTKWGNSLAVRIPKLFAVQLGVDKGNDVEVNMKDNVIVISSPGPSLETMLSQIKPENIHKETDTGDVTGSEIW